MKTHTTLDLDRSLLDEAAEALGTSRTTETVHAALRDVVARQRRARLARRDFSNLETLLPEMRAPRFTDLDQTHSGTTEAEPKSGSSTSARTKRPRA
ncbi:MAG: type II toxin-antitoxin system VapB family antitoxin [Terracoccus sp.]